jgi:hypothetical protein
MKAPEEMFERLKEGRWKWWVFPAAILIFGSLLFWIVFLNHVDINEVGIAYNSIGGKVWVQSKPGWYVTPPTVRVATITTLPLTVTIASEAKVINTKIVRFNPDGIDEFIRLQGFSYFSNQSIENVLLGYAYSGQKWPFLEVIQESGNESVLPKPLNK